MVAQYQVGVRMDRNKKKNSEGGACVGTRQSLRCLPRSEVGAAIDQQQRNLREGTVRQRLNVVSMSTLSNSDVPRRFRDQQRQFQEPTLDDTIDILS
jgi:hypothetical protein